jgi:hypothetical protein
MSRARDTSLTQVNSGGAVAPFIAGKNKLINGDFAINQRNFTSITAGNTYGFDRWQIQTSGPMVITYTPQTFTPGTAPVAGYESKNFARIVNGTASDISNASVFCQRIEDVRTLAGQTVTVSFWAKAATGTPSVTVELYQYFGTGGSPSADVSGIGAVKQSITTSWARYTATIAIPSISGKTIGTNLDHQLQLLLWTSGGSNFNSRNNSLGIQQSNTFDFWGVQLELGSKATNFSLATGSFATELATCQRYYQTSFDLGQTPAHNSSYFGETTLSCVNGGFSTNSYGAILFPVKMRSAPIVNIWNTRNASATGNSAKFYSAGVAYDTTTIDMGNTTSSSHGMTFKSNNMGATAIVFFGYSASAEL